jgi:hypothetical protein
MEKIRHQSGSQTIPTDFAGRWSRRTADAVLAVAASLGATKDCTVQTPDCARIKRFALQQNLGHIPDYPTFSLLRIFATLYISEHCDTERSFSALKYIKNYLRSMMGEQRLTDLLISTSRET